MRQNHRNATIDILRALTMLLMVFVNNLWMVDGYPQWLGHSAAMEDFMGLSDIVFPCFLIVVGMSIPYAIEHRFEKGESGVDVLRHILSRWLALIVMGVFTVNSELRVLTTTGMGTAWFRALMVIGFFLIWNAYSHRLNRRSVVLPLQIIGVLLLLFLGVTYRSVGGDVFQSRWWGILGIIGWTYLLCALLYLLVRSDLRWLGSTWLALVALCVVGSIKHGGGVILDLPEPNFFDQMMSALHINNGCEVALTASGIIIAVAWRRWGHSVRSLKLLVIAAVLSAVMLGCAILSDQFFITSKIMSTAPWLFYNLAIISLAYGVVACMARANLVGWYRWIKPAGSSTLTCYLVPYLLYSLISITGFRLPEVMATGFLGIATCILFVFLTVFVAYLLGLAHIKLKI